MFDPYTDLSGAWRLVANDAELLALMGLTGKSQLDIQKAIVMVRELPATPDPSPRLHIYFRPSRKARLSDMVTEEVLEVDAHVPVSQTPKAYQMIARVNKVLHNKEINGKQLGFDGQLGDLPTATSFFCVGARFCFYSLI